MGGKTTNNVSYRRVCEGDTGHAEAVKLVFDPSVVKYDELVGKSVLLSRKISIDFDPL